MPRPVYAISAAAVLTLAGCYSTYDNREVTGAAIGGAAGLITAAAFDASAGWVVGSTLLGAAAGTLIARNTRTGSCAYSNGDGTYYTAPC
mgnify:CR=1 FL=1